jgi:hypothetical protein
MRRTLIAAALFAASASVFAQAASAPSSPAKKELVAKVLKLQQQAIEGTAQALVEQPAARLMQQAGVALQARVPAEKREEVAKGIQADAKKFADEVMPMIRERAVSLGPTTIGPLLEERFTEDELKQLAGWLESPVVRRYQQLAPEMEKALSEKLIADTRGTIEPKLQALQQSIAQRLGGPAAPADAASGKKTIPPAPKASAAKK